MSAEKKISFSKRDLKGSKLRCLQLTALPGIDVTRTLNCLIEPYGKITDQDVWIPGGFLNPDEAQLDKVADIPVLKDKSAALKNWWLEQYDANTRTPNWDIISTCKVSGEDGLLLVEAKAHHGELIQKDPCGAGGVNLASITGAMNDINKQTGWNLSAEEHYQISNRFAWSWQLASMGVPVILVYLGFLNADEWADDKLKDHNDWEKSVREYSKYIVPYAIWNSKVSAGESYFYPLIRSLTMDISFK